MTQRTYGLTQLIGHGYAFTQRLVVADPAADTGFTYRNDGNYWELVDSLAFKLVSDSNAGSRVVTLTVADADGVPLAVVPANAALTASKTGLFTFLSNFSGSVGATDGPFLSGFPQILLQPMWSATVAWTNGHSSDQLSSIRLTVERFVTGPEGYPMGAIEEGDERDTLARVAALVG